MPEKDFEKQVQEKMGELKLRPGEPVWEKIEKKIRKEKRKRFFFFLPLVAALLLVGYTGYRFFMHADEEKNVNEKPTHKQSEAVKADPEPDPGIDRSVNVSEKDVAKETGAEKNQELTKQNVVNADEKIIDRQEEVVTRTLVRKSQPVNPIIKDRNAVKNPEKLQDQQKFESGHDSVAVRSSQNDEVVGDKKADSAAVQRIETNEKAVVITAADSTKVKTDKPVDSLVVSTKTIPEESTIAKISKKDKRSGFAIQVAIGISDIRSKPLSFSKTNPNLNLAAGPITGYPQGPPTRPITPSEINAGPAFSIGAEWHKYISGRSGFSTGLRYAYFSNKIEVGTKTSQPLQLAYDALANQTVLDYYGGSQNKKFTNRYHFLELPLEYHFRFNNKKKIGFDWATGISFGWLISSNELMYDTTRGGIYFHSDDLFNRNQLGLLTGLSIRFRMKNDAAFLLGPRAFLDLSRMTKDGFDRNRYLFAGTLQARYLFPVKTKK